MQIKTTMRYHLTPARMAIIKKYIEVLLINNVVLVSGVQQSDSVIHIQVSILFQVLFPLKLLQNIEQSSLCYQKAYKQ